MSVLDEAIKMYKDRIDHTCYDGSGFYRIKKINGVDERIPVGNKVWNYWRVPVHRRYVFAHILMWSILKGKVHKNMVVHHKHGSSSATKTDNNHISNLEMVSKSRNSTDVVRRINNRSGTSGVCWIKQRQKWVSYIGLNSKVRIYLGYFDDVNEARIVRGRAFILTHVENVKIKSNDDLEVFRARCYKRMKRSEFNGRIIEYLEYTNCTIDELCDKTYDVDCHVSLQHKIDRWKPSSNDYKNDVVQKVKSCFALKDKELFKIKDGTLVKVERVGRNHQTTSMCGFKIAVHKIVFILKTGLYPEGHIDHINNDPKDWSYNNIQILTSKENARKRTKMSHSSSPFRGVQLYKGKWKAMIATSSSYVNLGTYEDEKYAALVFDRAYVIRLIEDPILNTKNSRMLFRERCQKALSLKTTELNTIKMHKQCLNFHGAKL